MFRKTVIHGHGIRFHSLLMKTFLRGAGISRATRSRLCSLRTMIIAPVTPQNYGGLEEPVTKESGHFVISYDDSVCQDYYDVCLGIKQDGEKVKVQFL